MKLIQENCLKTMKEMKAESIDLVLTSPPYDDLRDYEKNTIWNFEVFKEIAKELYRITKKGGTVVWIVGDKTKNGNKTLTSFKQALCFQEIGFNVYDVIIYEKTSPSAPHKNRYFNAFEYMFIFTKGKPKTVNLLADRKNTYAGQKSGVVTKREKDGTLTKKEKKTIKEYGVRTNIWSYAVRISKKHNR